MSLDLYLEPQKCETCGHSEEGLNFNVTYNLSPMWYHLYPSSKDMLPIDGLSAKKSEILIDHYIVALINNKDVLRKLNPTNGWGTLDGFIETLRKMRNACEDHPEWIWSSCR